MRASLPRIASSMRSGVASWPISIEQPHDVGVRAAVQRSLQRADRADDRRVEIGERRSRDASGKGRRVQLVVGVQDQRDVEGARRQRARPRPGQHVEKVRRVPERRIRLDGTAARLQPPVGRDQARQLRRQPHRLAVVGLRRVVGRVRVEVAEDRGQRPQRVHAVARGQLLHEAQDRLAERPRRGELRLQIAELGAIRQAPVPQQVADLLERRALRQIVDVVAEIRQHATIAVEITDGGRRGDDVFETGLGLRVGGHGLILSRSQEPGRRTSSASPPVRRQPLAVSTACTASRQSRRKARTRR